MNSTRWSIFFALLGLTVLIPAYFIPAMLVANALDGSRWLSVWSGITTFWERGHYFLALLIFSFSLVFPLFKLGLCLLCAAGGGWLSVRFRQRVIALTEWTAKYSMLDVFVIALLILLVKVDEFVLMLPSLGLYLFSFAVLCSAVASALLKRGLAQPRPQAAAGPYLPWIFVGAALAAWGVTLATGNSGGSVDHVQLTNLTKRPIPRTVEKLLGLKEITKSEHSFWSKDTLNRVLEAVQAATTDAGWQIPRGYVLVETYTGRRLTSASQVLHLEDAHLTLDFALPETLLLRDIASIELHSVVDYAGMLPVDAVEERMAVNQDRFRTWTQDWYGRLFLFQWHGPQNPAFTWGVVLAVGGWLGCCGALSGLASRRRPLPQLASPASDISRGESV